MRWRTACGIATVVTTLLLSAAVPAQAGGYRDPTVSDPIVDGLAGPLQFEVKGSKILVGQSFSGTVSVVDRHGNVTDLFNDPGVDGVSWGWRRSVIYTHTDFETGEIELRMRDKHGNVSTIASTIEHETNENPDAGETYGLQGLTPECTAELEAIEPQPEMPPPPLPYTGIVDSHPYAVTSTPWGWLVADAGGNDILHVDWWGNVRTVAVLPPQEPIEMTAEAAAAAMLPPCVVGSFFVAEAVPTDVEIGKWGQLYVSTLPGGPEDPSLGARGSVYKVNPWSGEVTLVATGFAGASNLAISPRGDIYVAELFGNQVSKVKHGAPVPVAQVNQPSGLEWANGRLYVSTDSFGSGKIQTITF